ncbi:MAG: hypothetical protein ABSG52_08265 [Terriglobales bacterium]|jgi:hypothetical protein
MADLDVNVNPNQKDTTHLGKGKTVQFHTTADCRLHFTNPAVFNQMYVDLTTGKPQTLTVQNDGTTAWTALSPPSLTSKTPGRVMGNPNEIVVP